VDIIGRFQLSLIKNIFIYLIISIIGVAFLFGCGGGSSGSTDSPTPNDNGGVENTSRIDTKYLQEIDYIDLSYYHDNDGDTEFDVAMNRDASKVIYSFYSRRKLYALLFSDGQWQNPVLLGDNGNIISSLKTHRVIMNDAGKAALIHFADHRVGTVDTYAVSYFDGNVWQYTIEVPGTPIIDSYNDIICDIDSNGIVYIVSIPNDDVFKTEFTVSRFNNTGLIDYETFTSGTGVPGSTGGIISPRAIAINDLREVMLLYYYVEDKNSWPGITALFDGVNWSISQDWMPNPDIRSEEGPGKLRYNIDGSAYFVCGGENKGLTYARYSSGVWSNLYEGINFNDDFIESSFTLNEKGDELMVLRQDSGLQAECYSEYGVNNSFLSSSTMNPSIFYISSGAYVALFWDNSNMNSPMISYFHNGIWAQKERISNDWIQTYYYMNKYGYLVSSNSYMISISKFDDALLN
jgi:hypothetical protein